MPPSALDALDSQISKVKESLKECNGEAYQGCWIDIDRDRTGNRLYHRLRWFKSLKPRKLGCKTLKPDEVGQAQRAIALWDELSKLEKEREGAQQQLSELQRMAAALGVELKKPKQPQGQKDSDIWGTPRWVVELVREGMGRIDLDPCTLPSNPVGASKFYTLEDDGLLQPWHGAVYCNPPYSAPAPWLERFQECYQAGEVEQVFFLVKAGTFHNHSTGHIIKTADFKGHWRGRLKFEPLRPGVKSKSPDFDVAIAYWGPSAERMAELFNPYVF